MTAILNVVNSYVASNIENNLHSDFSLFAKANLDMIYNDTEQQMFFEVSIDDQSRKTLENNGLKKLITQKWA
jgi:hypothetical protein